MTNLCSDVGNTYIKILHPHLNKMGVFYFIPIRVAQLVERNPDTIDVTGSSPVSNTKIGVIV